MTVTRINVRPLSLLLFRFAALNRSNFAAHCQRSVAESGFVNCQPSIAAAQIKHAAAVCSVRRYVAGLCDVQFLSPNRRSQFVVQG